MRGQSLFINDEDFRLQCLCITTNCKGMVRAAIGASAPFLLAPRLLLRCAYVRETQNCQVWLPGALRRGLSTKVGGGAAVSPQHYPHALHTVVDCSGEKSLRAAVVIAASTEILVEAGQIRDAPSMHTVQISEASLRLGWMSVQD